MYKPYDTQRMHQRCRDADWRPMVTNGHIQSKNKNKKKTKKGGGDRIINLKFRTKSFHRLFLITQKPTNKINVSYRVSRRMFVKFSGSYFLTRNHSTYSACASLSSFFTYTLHTRTEYRCLVQGGSNMTGTMCV
jgi:hypothetical protein